MDDQQALGQALSEAAGDNNAADLAQARLVANGLYLADNSKPVDIDRVRAKMEADGYAYSAGNWMGLVFKGWVAVGFIRSEHKGSRGRMIRQWRPRWSKP